MKHRVHFFAAVLSIAFLTSSLMPQMSGRTARAASIIAYECEGNACSQITVTWDESKEQYKVQNNSSDQWVRVEAANLVSSASLCLGPNKSDYLSLKTVVGAFRVNLAEENCGKKT